MQQTDAERDRVCQDDLAGAGLQFLLYVGEVSPGKLRGDYRGGDQGVSLTPSILLA
jgi:hypothetical protein